MYGCCIVETRVIPNLSEIINEHLKFIPSDWGLTIYCSKENRHLLKGLTREARVFYLNDKFTVDSYNILFKSVGFWDSLPYEKVLIFQTDSMLLRNGIEDFLEWDYVGAAWKFQAHGGNGGLSLRNVSIMKQIVSNYQFSMRNEDVLICNIMKSNKIGKLAPREVCRQFSCEAIFDLGTLGYHAIEKYLTKEQCKLIKNQYNG